MERLLEIEEFLQRKNAGTKNTLAIADIFSNNDPEKRRSCLLKNQNSISLNDLLQLCDENDSYLELKSIEIICIRYTDTLRDDPNSYFWQFVKDTIMNGRDYEIVNFLLNCLRNFFIETLECGGVGEDLQSDFDNSIVLFEKDAKTRSMNLKKGFKEHNDKSVNVQVKLCGPSSKMTTYANHINMSKNNKIAKENNKFLPYVQRCDQRRKVECFRVSFISDTAIQEKLLSFIQIDDLCYNTLFLIWLLSFTEKVFEALSPVDLIKALENKIKKDTQDKVVRIACLVFMNIKEHDLFISLKNLHLMLNTSKIMLNKKSEDTEYNHDKKELYNYIMKKIKNISSVENYLKELYSGHLERTLYHFEESFWNVNLSKLQIKKHEIIKAIRLYLKRGDRQNVIIALNDLFMFHNIDASVGRLIENYGVKDQLIELCGSNDSEIQFLALQAFLCVLNHQLY